MRVVFPSNKDKRVQVVEVKVVQVALVVVCGLGLIKYMRVVFRSNKEKKYRYSK